MRHEKAEGAAVIAAIAELGHALHYDVAQEHVVGKTAAVDVSWAAARHSDVPLFVFEVESTASSAMANNALKVLGPPNERLLKPLFFFHVVLSGSPSNERVANLHSQWSQHNYRVYRWAETEERRRLVLDVLLQHRRISQHVIVRSIAAALECPSWALDSVDGILQDLEGLGFLSNYLRDYALLARQDAAYLTAYCRRVAALRDLSPTATPQVDNYGGSGNYLPGLLETGLLISGGSVRSQEAPAALEAFQTQFGMHRAIGASFGLSRDYDMFVLRIAPLHYAVAACLMRRSPEAHEWLITDLHRIMNDAAAFGIDPLNLLPMAHWLAHIVAGSPRWTLSAEAAYAEAREVLFVAGGVSPDRILDPYMPMDAEAALEAATDGIGLPEAAQLHHQVMASAWPPETMEPYELALTVLLDDDWPRIGAAPIVALLHGVA